MYRHLFWAFRDLHTFCQLDEQKRELYLDNLSKDFTRKRLLFFDRTVALALSL